MWPNCLQVWKTAQAWNVIKNCTTRVQHLTWNEHIPCVWLWFSGVCFSSNTFRKCNRHYMPNSFIQRQMTFMKMFFFLCLCDILLLVCEEEQTWWILKQWGFKIFCAHCYKWNSSILCYVYAILLLSDLHQIRQVSEAQDYNSCLLTW